MTLKQKIEYEELRQRALKLNLCPECGEHLKIYYRHISTDPKPTDIYKKEDGCRGTYLVKECSEHPEHFCDEQYNSYDSDEA